METVTLQEALRRIDEINEGDISDNELRLSLDSFHLDPPKMQESDPFSPAYRQDEQLQQNNIPDLQTHRFAILQPKYQRQRHQQ